MCVCVRGDHMDVNLLNDPHSSARLLVMKTLVEFQFYNRKDSAVQSERPLLLLSK